MGLDTGSLHTVLKTNNQPCRFCRFFNISNENKHKGGKKMLLIWQAFVFRTPCSPVKPFLEGNQGNTIHIFSLYFTSQLNPIDKMTWLNHQWWLRWQKASTCSCLNWVPVQLLEKWSLGQGSDKGKPETLTASPICWKSQSLSLQSTAYTSSEYCESSSRKTAKLKNKAEHARKHWLETLWGWTKNMYHLLSERAGGCICPSY